MDLFELDENSYTVKLNRVWLWLIPEFADILKRDKGSAGDKGGARKMWARQRFAYIYFYVDFKSPIYSWEEGPKQEESLRYSGLTKEDLKPEYVSRAVNMYKELQFKAARSLRTLEAVNKGLEQLNNYFENIDFTMVDKQGKLLYSPTDYVKNISTLNKAYDELNAFEKRVLAELTKSGGIRGTATKGDKENDVVTSKVASDTEWTEAGNPNPKTPNWLDLSTGTTSL